MESCFGGKKKFVKPNIALSSPCLLHSLHEADEQLHFLEIEFWSFICFGFFVCNLSCSLSKNASGNGSLNQVFK
jgi:hypothetical protein